MTIHYTQVESGYRSVAVGDYEGFSARVVTGWEVRSDKYLVHLYIGKRDEAGQDVGEFKKIDATDLFGHSADEAFKLGFILAAHTIDELRAA